MARRPFLGPGISLGLGILLGRFVRLPPAFVFLLILSSLPFLWFFRGRRLFLPLFLLSVALLGMLRIHQSLKLPPNHIVHFAQGDWVSLQGKVVSLPEVKVKGKRQIHSFVLESEDLVRKKELFVTTGKVQVFLFNPGPAPAYGSCVRLRGKLTPPKSPKNPGEFDYRNFLALQGIHTVFEGYGPKSFRVLDCKGEACLAPTDILALIQKIRSASAERLDALFTYPTNALLKALILGLRKDLPEDYREDFIKTGTAHLVAISGMHITLVAGSLFLLALLWGSPQKGAAVVGLLAAAAYVLLSGARIPAIRAGWMAGLFFTGVLLEREKDLLNSLFFALFAILAFDPLALFQVGFQLSFLSVLALILFASHTRFFWGGEWFGTGIVLLGTLPLCLLYFHVFSWVSLLANLLAIPLFHLGVLGGMAGLLLGSLPGVGFLFIGGASLALKSGLAWIQFWAARPWGYFYLSPPSWGGIAFYYAALASVLLLRRFPKSSHLGFLRPLSISLWLLAAASFFFPWGRPDFRLTLLAAGENELFHVEFSGRRHWLVNAGRGNPSNQARWLLTPFLRQRGVNHLEGVIFTDFSRRHTGGLPTLLSNFSVGALAFPAAAKVPPELESYVRPRGITRWRRLPLRAGDQIPIRDGAGFSILKIGGDRVCLLIKEGNKKFLFLSTWKEGSFREMAPHFDRLGPVEALILPAWGVPTPTQWQALLEGLRPQHVVLTKKKPEWKPLLEVLEAKGIPYAFLAETGALRFEIRGKGLRVQPFLD